MKTRIQNNFVAKKSLYTSRFLFCSHTLHSLLCAPTVNFSYLQAIEQFITRHFLPYIFALTVCCAKELLCLFALRRVKRQFQIDVCISEVQKFFRLMGRLGRRSAGTFLHFSRMAATCSTAEKITVCACSSSLLQIVYFLLEPLLFELAEATNPLI